MEFKLIVFFHVIHFRKYFKTLKNLVVQLSNLKKNTNKVKVVKILQTMKQKTFFELKLSREIATRVIMIPIMKQYGVL